MLSITSSLCIERLTRFLFNSNQIKDLYNAYAINFNNIHLASYQHESDEKYKDIAYKEYKEQLTNSNNRDNSYKNQRRIEGETSKLLKRAFYFSDIATYFTATSIVAISKGNKREAKKVDKLTKVNFTNGLKNNGLKIIKLVIEFFLNSQQFKVLSGAFLHNTELCYAAWHKDQHANNPLIKKIGTIIEAHNENCKNSGIYKGVYRGIREEAPKPSNYLNNLIYGLLPSSCASEISKLLGDSKIVAGNSVEFSKRDTLYTNNFAANEINSKSRYKKKAFGNFYEPI